MATIITAVRAAAIMAFSAIVLAACGGTTSGPAATASPSASPSAAPTPTPTPAPSAAPVVLAQSVGTMGTLLVAASNSHTVYTFGSDSPGGASNCNSGCSGTWPALTIASGQTPTGGPGVTGQLGTITRSDGSIQVTYKGLPLYFFHNDAKPGDTNGNYTGWNLVKP